MGALIHLNILTKHEMGVILFYRKIKRHNMGMWGRRKSMKLKLKRIEKGIKQYELSEKVGISRYYLSSLERGKSKNPSNMLMLKLAQELDTSVEELFFDKGE